MASKKTARKAQRKRSASRRTPTSGSDAITLLKADHRQVTQWFAEFQKSRGARQKQSLAERICAALRVHTSIEDEIFYPAFLEATKDTQTHHEAEVEHNSAERLIAEIEESGPEDDYYDAKVKVLSEMIKHHVNEEEKRDGMFAEARRSKLDLKELGARLAARKAQLTRESEGSEDDVDVPVPRSGGSSSSGRSERALARAR